MHTIHNAVTGPDLRAVVASGETYDPAARPRGRPIRHCASPAWGLLPDPDAPRWPELLTAWRHAQSPACTMRQLAAALCVAERTVRTARCPVLTVKAAAKKG